MPHKIDSRAEMLARELEEDAARAELEAAAKAEELRRRARELRRNDSSSQGRARALLERLEVKFEDLSVSAIYYRGRHMYPDDSPTAEAFRLLKTIAEGR